MINLGSRNGLGMSVSASQLIFSWPDSAGNARFALMSAGDAQQVLKKSTKRHSINVAIAKFQVYQKRLRDVKREKTTLQRDLILESCKLMVAVLLEAGADIHKVNSDSLTPFSVLAA